MPHVDGVDDGSGYGVRGRSDSSTGVVGRSLSGIGMRGFSDSYIGVSGSSDSGTGVSGISASCIGVLGYSYRGTGMRGYSQSFGVHGSSHSLVGVLGDSDIGVGVYGESNNYVGVYAWSYGSTGIYAYSVNDLAAFLNGRVYISGPLYKPGGSFKIDHPLDPANKYLSHSFVESPDMKNVYDGVVVLDNNGQALIDLPDWFAALNKDFRYQLTAIGAPGPNLYIAQEISDIAASTTTNYSDISSNSNNNNSNNCSSHFKIAGGTSGMKVSWQVTGIRKDPWANANRIEVEQDKPTKERGYIYIHIFMVNQKRRE